jgi:hypothetical protein
MDIADNCSCIAGIPSIHGHRRQLLLHCRHTVHPWTSPTIAPALPAYRPSMDIADNCSCIAGIPSIHGHKKAPQSGAKSAWNYRSFN